MFHRCVTGFFAWLDERRDKKLQRQMALVQAQLSAQQATAMGAIDALKAHTELMKLWLTGFQNISLQGQVPFSSVVRDEDEYRAEVERMASNIDGLAPWKSDVNFDNLFKELD